MMSSVGDEMETSIQSEASAMWMQIQRMPFQQLQETKDFVYIEKVMTLVARYVFIESDPCLRDPKYTVCIARLLKTVSAKCIAELETVKTQEGELRAEIANLRKGFDAQLSSKLNEIEKLEKNLQNYSSQGTSEPPEHNPGASIQNARWKAENDTLSLKIQSLTRQNDELKQLIASRSEDRTQFNDNYDKAQLEYRHLAARFKRLTDRSAKTEDMLEEVRRQERTKKHDTNDELERLRQKILAVQQENQTLVASRDRAEELCEKREAEALRDMTELRRLNRDLLEEERAKFQALRDELLSAKQESDAHVEQLIQQHDDDLEEKEQEINAMRHQLEKASSKRKGWFNGDETGSRDDSSSSSSARGGGFHTERDKRRLRALSTEEQRKVERENDDLRAEVEQFELRIDALDEENRRLTRLIKSYESGDEGLYRLRQELADQTRSVEVLQIENAQLRERLNSMEDSITFNAALLELCKRVGVTESEINSLRPQNAAAYSEMDTLKEEVRLLKEEVEWLERERRYWMNKVRLQPLMDTKLRFELGLTSVQLQQLDKLVDQMKSGAVVIEENDENYKDKYFKELQARRRDSEQFNSYVKQRINDALKDAFVDLSNSNAAAAVTQLRDHIDVITATPSSESSAQAELQIRTMTQRIEELERVEKTRAEQMARLREQTVSSAAEQEAIARERDQYRDAIFGAAGLSREEDGSQGLGERRASAASNAKWLKVSNTLREQLQTKDVLIDTLGKELTEAKERLSAERQRQYQVAQDTERHKEELSALADQIKALTELNEETTAKCTALSKVNKDLEEGLNRLSDGRGKDTLLKVVLLRRREATLLQRLRRALAAQEDAGASEKKMQSQVACTLEKLREALEETATTGAVLPRSAGTCGMEGEMLSYLDAALQQLLQGKLFREDSRFLLHLKEAYQEMETRDEVAELRLDVERLRAELTAKQTEFEAYSAEAEGLRATITAATDAKANPSPEYANAARAKAEAEAATYRQKYSLVTKRLEGRDAEVAQLEGDLEVARREVVEVRDHIRNLLSEVADAVPPAEGTPRARGKMDMSQLARLEREVARLKSVNLGLLHHSMDLQSQIKSLEVEMSAKQQEITLLKSSSDSQLVSSFVSAAIREHAALRRQSELALIQTKRLRMQLAATEANYHVVANEATNYKLGAYRLYRKYVEQVVTLVDYLRCVQRASKGGLSPRQAEIMDRRLSKAIGDLGECFGRNKMLAMELSDAQSAVATLEHQLAFLRTDDGVARKEARDTRLQEVQTRLREHDRLMVESREDRQYLEGKLSRAEDTVKQLNAEVARLEFGYLATSPLDEELLAMLLQLKESVFDKTVTPSLAIEAAASLSSPLRSRRAGGRGTSGEDPDEAVREYRSAVLRQTELAQQCAALKTQLTDVTSAHRRAEQRASQLRDEVQQAAERANFAKRQVEEERAKSEQRESRLLRAYETQSDVARRATEHNVQCLQEMIKKKEATIASLQEQLSAARQKYMEHELGEAVRMERLHEHMFRENTAMVERFKSAIDTVGDNVRQTSDAAAVAPHLLLSSPSNGMEEQLRVLTAETARLRQELKEALTSNIVLESQLEQHVQQQLTTLPIAAYSGAGTASPDGGMTDISVPPNANADALMIIVRNQTAMVDSLRQREMQLSAELQREKDQRASAEKLLLEAQRQHIEQGGTLQLLSQATGAAAGSDAPLVSELRAQNAYLDQELRELRRALEEERAQTSRFQMDASEWKNHLDSLQSAVTAQQGETDRAQRLASLNEGLQSDLNTLREQNDKLVMAASLLKQRLMDEAHRSGESTRQHQQEIALAQRMGTIQQESVGQMKTLDHRIGAIQKELNERVAKERGLLEKNTESQRIVFQLHQQLREKDRELVSLRDQLRQRGSGAAMSPHARSQEGMHARASSPGIGAAHRGTQMLSTRSLSPKTTRRAGGAGQSAATPPRPTTADSPSSVAGGARALQGAQDFPVPPHVANAIHREARREQRDHMAELSSLRSRVRRLEQDLEDATMQLRGEREATRQLRLQVRQPRDGQAEGEQRDHAGSPATAHSVSLSPLPRNTADDLGPARAASPLDIRNHVMEVRRMEVVVDGLRHRLSVELPAHENELQQRVGYLSGVVQRMTADLAAVRGVSISQIESMYATATTSATTTVAQRSPDELNSELLRKSNEVLELRFQIETLELHRSRAERHLREVLAVDAASAAASTGPGRSGGAANVEALTNVIENLKLVIDKLQSENAELHSMRAQGARYARQTEELHALQGRERGLKEQLQRVSEQLLLTHAAPHSAPGSSVHSSSADLHRRLATAQAAAQQYEGELEELRRRLSSMAEGATPTASPTAVPPPLPQSRFAPVSVAATSPSMASAQSSLSGGGALLQRRLSTTRLSRSGDEAVGGDAARPSSSPSSSPH